MTNLKLKKTFKCFSNTRGGFFILADKLSSPNFNTLFIDPNDPFKSAHLPDLQTCSLKPTTNSFIQKTENNKSTITIVHQNFHFG